MGTVNELLAIARKQIGVTEMPPSSNNVRYNTWYYGREVMGSGYPWCMVFVQWCFAQAGVKLPKRTASCGDLMRAAQDSATATSSGRAELNRAQALDAPVARSVAAGCWVVRDFQPGDVVIYDFPGGAATDHCGIVELELPDYGVQAIEGNTSVSGSQSNGGMVCRRNRPSKYIVGAVRPQFDEEEDEMDINTMISQMTDAQAYALMEKAQRHAAALPAPDWATVELSEAKALGITDGSRPMGLTMRYETAIMTKRAASR